MSSVRYRASVDTEWHAALKHGDPIDPSAECPLNMFYYVLSAFRLHCSWVSYRGYLNLKLPARVSCLFPGRRGGLWAKRQQPPSPTSLLIYLLVATASSNRQSYYSASISGLPVSQMTCASGVLPASSPASAAKSSLFRGSTSCGSFSPLQQDSQSSNPCSTLGSTCGFSHGLKLGTGSGKGNNTPNANAPLDPYRCSPTGGS